MDPAQNFWRGAPQREAPNLMNFAHESRFNARRRQKFWKLARFHCFWSTFPAIWQKKLCKMHPKHPLNSFEGVCTPSTPVDPCLPSNHPLSPYLSHFPSPYNLLSLTLHSPHLTVPHLTFPSPHFPSPQFHIIPTWVGIQVPGKE